MARNDWNPAGRLPGARLFHRRLDMATIVQWVVPNEAAEALEAILEYLFEDERKDYEQTPVASRKYHIFEQLCVLRDYLAECGAKCES